MECSKVGQVYCEVKLSLFGTFGRSLFCFVLFCLGLDTNKSNTMSFSFFDFQCEKIIFNCPIDPPTFNLSMRSLRSKNRNADRMDQKVSFFLDCEYVYELV